MGDIVITPASNDVNSTAGTLVVRASDLNPISLKTNDVNRLYIDPTGSVGIGTTLPTGGLHINYTPGAFSEALRLQRNNGIFYSVGLDTNFLNIAYNGNVNANNVFVLTNAGYLGVGNLQNALVNLDVASTHGKGIQLRFDATTGYRAQIIPYWSTNIDTRIDFAINRVSNLVADVIMSVGYDNNVGIGTVQPSQKLDVRGNIKLGADNAGNYVYYVKDNEGTIIRTTRSDVTQQGLFRSDGWGNFTADKSIGIGYSLGSNFASSLIGNGNLYVANTVGINTTSPTSKLNVVETTATGTRIQLGTSQEGTIMSANATNDLLILNAPYGANAATTSNLGAKWGIKFVGAVDGNLNNNNKTSAIYAVSEDSLGYNRGTSLAFYTNQWNDIPYSEKMRIYHNGNVGIGVSSPFAKLHVSGNAQLSGLLGASLNINTNNAGNGNISFDGTTFSIVSNSNSAPIILSTSSTERVRLTSAGRLGIWNTNPDSLLSVGSAGSTLAASGLTFGADPQANLYRSSEDIIKTDGGLIVTNNLLVGELATNPSTKIRVNGSFSQRASGNTAIQEYKNIVAFNLDGYGNGGYVIRTPFKIDSAFEMPIVHVKGYGYGDSKIYDFKVVFYDYAPSNQPINYSLVDLGNDGSPKFLAKDANNYLQVCFGNTTDVNNYYYRFTVDCISTRNDKDYSQGWGMYQTTGANFGFASTGIYALNSPLNFRTNLGVGLGTTNPQNKLSVIGSVNIGSNNFNTAAPTNGLIVEGNVGIGTTNPASLINGDPAYFRPNPFGKFLDVYSSANEANINLITNNSGDGSGIGGIYFTRARGQTDAHLQVAAIKAIQGGTNGTLAGGKLYFYTKSNGGGTLETSPAMTIDTAGNIGIGVTAPASKVQISGVGQTIMRLDSDTLTNVSQFQIKAGADSVLVAGMYGPNPVAGTIFGANTSGAAYLGTSTLGTFHPTLLAIGNISTIPILFGTNNTERMRIDSIGNVGIGTTNPSTKLHVYGVGGGFEFGVGSSNCYIETIDRANTSAFINTSYYTRGTGYFAWYNGSYTERMRIDDAGNVGIGTTRQSGKLHVAGNIFLSADLIGNDGTRGYLLGKDSVSAGRSYLILDPNAANGIGVGSDYLYIAQENTTGVISNSAGPLLLNPGGGNVGIGTTNAVAQFHIGGTASNNNPWAVLDIADTYFKRIVFSEERVAYGITAYGGYIGYDATANTVSLGTYDNSTENRSINILRDNGNVGIGITNPTYTLQVGGTFYVNSTSFFNGAMTVEDSLTVDGRLNGSDGVALLTMRAGNSAGSWNDVNLQYEKNSSADSLHFNMGGSAISNASVRLTVQNNGNIGIGTTRPGGLLHVFNTTGRYITYIAGSASGLLIQKNAAVTSQGATLLTLVNAQGPETFPDRGTALNLDIGYSGTPTIGGSIARGARIAALNYNIYDAAAANQNAYLSFYTATGGTLTEKVRIQADGKVGIGTASPATILGVGGAGSTTAASGITFGGDAQANLYRTAEDTLRTDGGLIAGTYLRALNYVQLLTNVYPDSYTDYLRLNVGNAAGNAWENYPVVIKRGAYVGIGTDTPTGKLHVVSSVAGETVFRADGTNGTLFSVVDDLSDSLMSVNNSAGLPVLEVFADDRVVAGQYGSGDLVVRNNKVGIGTTNPINKLSVIGSASIGSTYNVAAPTNGLIVEGNVGIGSTNPVYKLDCYSTNAVAEVARFFNNQTACNFSVGSSSNSQYSNYILYTNDGNVQLFRGGNAYSSWGGASSLNIYNSNGPIAFHPNNTANSMFLSSSGNLGIGETSPDYKLTVHNRSSVSSNSDIEIVCGGAGQASLRMFEDNSGTHTVYGARVYYEGAGNNFFNIATIDGGTETIGFTLNRYSNVGIGTTIPAEKLDVRGGLIRSNTRVTNDQGFPVGHHSAGETVFEIDPTWSQLELQKYFNSTLVSWAAVADAPGGYCIYIDGAVNAGGFAGSGFPYIPVDTNDIFYMECWIQNVGTAQGHYMGSQDFDQSFSSLGGNPGSYGYWVMSNYNPTTTWTKVSGYISGFSSLSSDVGKFKTGTKYWTPQALFNYTAGTGTRACRISGWKVIKVYQVGDRSFAGNVNVAADLYVADELGVGVPIANKRLNYGAQINAVSASIQLVLGRTVSSTGQGAIGADENNTFGVYNVSGGITKQFSVTQQGDVGVGNTTPTSRLTVVGPTLTTNTKNTYAAAIGNDNNTDLTFGADASYAYIQSWGTKPLYINNQGNNVIVNANVGIGLTNPSYRLVVSGGDVNIASANILRFGTVAVLNESSNADDIYANIRVIRNRSSVNQDGMYINYDSQGATTAHLRFYANAATERMRIDASNGNVGIGVTNPATRLQVANTGTITSVATIRIVGSTGNNAGSQVEFYKAQTAKAAVGLASAVAGGGTSDDLLLLSTNPASIVFNAGANGLVAFKSDGNVGIGLTNPAAARLHIKGDGTNPVLRVETALLEAGTTTSSKTFVAWLPIMTGAAVGDKVFIPLFK